jgi:hypothetical protein
MGQPIQPEKLDHSRRSANRQLAVGIIVQTVTNLTAFPNNGRAVRGSAAALTAREMEKSSCLRRSTTAADVFLAQQQ